MFMYISVEPLMVSGRGLRAVPSKHSRRDGGQVKATRE